MSTYTLLLLQEGLMAFGAMLFVGRYLIHCSRVAVTEKPCFFCTLLFQLLLSVSCGVVLAWLLHT